MLQFSTYKKDFDEQMKICNNSKLTKIHYKSDVEIFINYFKNKPSFKHINSKEVISWLLTFNTYNTRKAKHSAVKWFYKYVIHQKHKFRFIPYGKKEKRLPIIIDQEDVQKMFDVCDNLKHKAIMATLYGTGVRKAELLGIKISDILSKQGVIRIIGKGNKERLVPLHENIRTTMGYTHVSRKFISRINSPIQSIRL